MRAPVFTSLAGYRGDWLRGDIVAGLIDVERELAAAMARY